MGYVCGPGEVNRDAYIKEFNILYPLQLLPVYEESKVLSVRKFPEIYISP